MAKFEKCGHYDGLCPCMSCLLFDLSKCSACLETRYDGGAYTVDTSELCEAARMYCESGRETDGE